MDVTCIMDNQSASATSTMTASPSAALWIFFSVCIISSTIFGNVLILVSIYKHCHLRDNMYILIGNLAVSDLLVGIVLVPYYLLLDGGQLEGSHGVIPINKYTCLLKPCVYVCCLGSSCLGLLLISLERYLTIRFPLRAKILVTRKRLCIALIIGWAVVFVNGTFPLYVWNSYDGNNSSCVSDDAITKEYKLLINWELITCLVFNFCLYALAVRIAYVKSVEWRQRNTVCTQRAPTDTDFHHIVTTVIVFGVFFICWLPYAVSAIALTVDENPTTQYIRRCALIPGLLNSGINWLIYGYRNTAFRASFRSLLTGKGVRVGVDAQSSLELNISSRTVTTCN